MQLHKYFKCNSVLKNTLVPSGKIMNNMGGKKLLFYPLWLLILATILVQKLRTVDYTTTKLDSFKF